MFRPAAAETAREAHDDAFRLCSDAIPDVARNQGVPSKNRRSLSAAGLMARRVSGRAWGHCGAAIIGAAWWMTGGGGQNVLGRHGSPDYRCAPSGHICGPEAGAVGSTPTPGSAADRMSCSRYELSSEPRWFCIARMWRLSNATAGAPPFGRAEAWRQEWRPARAWKTEVAVRSCAARSARSWRERRRYRGLCGVPHSAV